jgi:hypothetical protein
MPLNTTYFAQMLFPEGKVSCPIIISDKIILSCDDPVLNYTAEKISQNHFGVMVVFGLGKIKVFKYKDKKLIELK